MDNTNNPTPLSVDLSTLIDGLMTVAQEKQIRAEKEGQDSLRLEFDAASVTVNAPIGSELLVFDCASKTGDSTEVVSTCMPLAAAAGERGAANAFDFAEMLTMLLGFTPAPEIAELQEK
ncbi:hypothetical protein [Hydrogenophaga sp.]|uniref:hypothetical protein n=1 Tax=Hydrogenophaga sp. TaxID=1904254 RepID=UPI0035AE556B